MKKLKFLSGILAIAVCLVGCNNASEELKTLNKNEVAAIDGVKSEITALNVNYMNNLHPQTRLPKWLRWVILGAADTAGAIFGGFGGACSASSLAWTIMKDELASKRDTVQTMPKSAFKPNNLRNLEVGSMGYVHNIVITNMFINNEDIYLKSNEDIMNLVFVELESQTGVAISDSQKVDIISKTNRIVGAFDVNKSLDEYYNELMKQTRDFNQKKALEVCGMILDGLQYVDDNDTTYITKVRTIINNSNMNPELKTIILDGVSVADASVKLWNTDDISAVLLQ